MVAFRSKFSREGCSCGLPAQNSEKQLPINNPINLADHGIVLGNQTVLLKGVNDDPAVIQELFFKLLKMRVRPYYLHQMDLVRGGGHFRTSLATGLEIMASLRGPISGLASPHYVIDLPGGKGKVPLLPEVVSVQGESTLIRSASGGMIDYPDI